MMTKVIEEAVVEVKASITVAKNTAEACLKLVELYINQNNVELIGNAKEDGTIEFYFQEGVCERIKKLGDGNK